MKGKILASILFVCFANKLNSSVVQFPKKEVDKNSVLNAALKKISNHKNNDEIANLIIDESNKLNLDPKIFMAIIKVESNFNQKAISSTGDISIVQINYAIWQREFNRLKLEKISKERLSSDYIYSIKMMGKILAILKERHSKYDKLWFARYHSSTNTYKNKYYDKMKIQINHINQAIAQNFSKKTFLNPVY